MRVIDLSTLSMVGGSGIAETKIPLWWSDGTTISTTNQTIGGVFLNDGGAIGSSASASQAKLFMLSSNWLSTTEFALEVTMYSNSNVIYIYSILWDMTTNSQIGGAVISTASTTATTIRSGQFTLISGHQYGVTSWLTGSGGVGYISDASLIVFPQ